MVHSDAARVLHERDLYRKLLELGQAQQPKLFLGQALDLMVETLGAQLGHMEISEEPGGSRLPRFGLTRGGAEADEARIRGLFSTGIIAQVLSDGHAINLIDAQTHQQFAERGSVQANHIEAVLCVPILTANKPIGVLYLQNRWQPGAFSLADQEIAEVFARQVAPFVDRLLLKERENNESDATKPYRARLKAEEVVGRSRALAKALAEVATFARHDLSVLFTGPSGTGKSQMARVLHKSSPRAAGPFVELNAADLSAELGRSQLFGHQRGSFTGADRSTHGSVAAAEGGTLFIDEVAELDEKVQAQLLTFLENRRYIRLGDNREVKADVRVVAATNANLSQRVAEKRFRDDLLFRLGHVIHIPSLAERREDIEPLVLHILDTIQARHNLPPLTVSPNALRAIEEAEWPGNIRELSTVLEGAAARAEGDGADAAGVVQINGGHIFPDAASSGARPRTLRDAIHDFKKEYVRKSLAELNWSVTDAAQTLDVSRQHLHELIRLFDLRRPA